MSFEPGNQEWRVPRAALAAALVVLVLVVVLVFTIEPWGGGGGPTTLGDGSASVPTVLPDDTPAPIDATPVAEPASRMPGWTAPSSSSPLAGEGRAEG